jgi:hypothetical protein
VALTRSFVQAWRKSPLNRACAPTDSEKQTTEPIDVGPVTRDVPRHHTVEMGGIESISAVLARVGGFAKMGIYQGKRAR